MNVNDKPKNASDTDEIGRRNRPKEKFWRGLADLQDSPEARRFRENEFPYAAADIEAASLTRRKRGLSRREVLKYMAASAALAGLTACTKLPTEKIVPYVRPPEEIVPGKPLFYATSMTFGGEGVGLLAESYMGRPTKMEGNPEHPGSVGHTDIWGQAATLDLYDPYRSQTVIHNVDIGTWDDFYTELQRLRADWSADQGAGVHILTENIISPTLGAQMRAFLAAFPQAKWHQFEPWGRDNSREGAKLAFGEYAHPVYNFENADVILALDADFLALEPGHVRYTRDYAARRNPDDHGRAMNRLYVIEAMPSITGAMADHRLPMRVSEVEGFARLLAANLGIAEANPPAPSNQRAGDWAKAVAKELQTHRGSSLVIAGEAQPPVV